MLKEGKIRHTRQRWDTDFLFTEILPFREVLKKIIVCGPPRLNQSLEQSLNALVPLLDLDQHIVDVL